MNYNQSSMNYSNHQSNGQMSFNPSYSYDYHSTMTHEKKSFTPNRYQPYTKIDKTLKSSHTPNPPNYYTPSQITQSRSQHDVQSFYSQKSIFVKGDNVPNPLLTFEEAPFPGPILQTIAAQQWDRPTPIQSISWPIALSGRDMVAIAQTGSGKTLGFLIPALIHISNSPPLGRNDGPICLVLCPTRELAVQVKTVADDFGTPFKIRNACIYGGAPKHMQQRELERSPQIIIACPGRLLDFMEGRKINLSRCSFLILDEADRMLDMGFEPQIRKIITKITNPNRQTLMFSATWPKEVHALANDFLYNYVQTNIGSLEVTANKNITQNFVICEEGAKDKMLSDILKDLISDGREHKMLIFVETKRACDMMNRSAQKMGWPSDCIHGDKVQSERERTLKNFREGRCPILIATDVAARGLDVDDVEYIINYDFPHSIEDYVHRIGRTARCGKTGTAYTLFTPKNTRFLPEIKRILTEAGQEVPQELLNMAGSYGSYGGSSGGGGRGQRFGRGGGGGRGGYGGGGYGSNNRGRSSWGNDNYRR